MVFVYKKKVEARTTLFMQYYLFNFVIQSLDDL